MSGPVLGYFAEKPYLLVEDGAGGTYRVVLSEVTDPRARQVIVGPVRYEHCAEASDGRWIYRAS